MKYFLLFLLCSAAFSSYAQPDEPEEPVVVICYQYDDAGNRTQRSIEVKSMSHPPPKPDKGEETADELTEAEKSLETQSASWRAYPNPSFGIVNYDLSLSTSQRLTISVYDMSGKRLLQTREKSDGFGQIDIAALSPGDYVLQIESKRQSKSWTIVKR